MKKCPPGVICIENFSMFFMAICVLIVVYLIYNSTKSSEKIVIKNTQRESVGRGGGGGGFFGGFLPSWPYTNLPSDPLSNPYAPPLRDERYFVPINVSTNIGAVPENTSYRQLGILTATNSKGAILPLMGRPVFTNRDKWQYYTMSDQNNSVKLPVSRNGRSCTNEYGCDRLFNGDTVYIEGLNEPYKVTMYDNDTIRYLPAI
jgi:hypothetical protein